MRHSTGTTTEGVDRKNYHFKQSFSCCVWNWNGGNSNCKCEPVLEQCYCEKNGSLMVTLSSKCSMDVSCYTSSLYWRKQHNKIHFASFITASRTLSFFFLSSKLLLFVAWRWNWVRKSYSIFFFPNCQWFWSSFHFRFNYLVTSPVKHT